MPQSEYHISKLITSQINGSISAAEKEQLSAWIAESEENLNWYQEFIKEETLTANIKRYNRVNTAAVYHKLEAKLAASLDPIVSKQTQTTKIQLWSKIAVAAAAVVAIAFGIYFFNASRHPEGIEAKRDLSDYTTKIVPGTNGATLTLANGKKIYLKDAASGAIANAASTLISKTADGKIVYTAKDQLDGTAEYNTLETHKGEQIQVVLPDQSIVYLNAASSLTYPSSFGKLKERIVKLTGEGYFEVSKDKTHPFIVQTSRQEVEVLGTHFNINAYSDESGTKTTLLEGSVAVSSLRGGTTKQSSQSITLKPNQQATLTNNKIKVADVEAEDAVDWKNGYFMFNSETLESAVNRIGRWYNVEISYDNPEIKKETFFGRVSRYEDLAKVLTMLEGTGVAKFKLEGRTIRIIKRE